MTAAIPRTPPRPLLPGMALRHTSQWVNIRFDSPRPALGSAVVNGGLTIARHWLNLKVSGNVNDGMVHPRATVAALCGQHNWSGNTVAMMTAASMDSLRIRYGFVENRLALVAVTSGLANARRVGDRAEHRQLNDGPDRFGTINIAVITDLRLSVAVMVEALMIATEAKTAALQQRDIRSPVSGALATGTGTDAVAVFAGIDGPRADYAGKHTILGEILGRLALAAISDSIDQRGPVFSNRCENLEETSSDPTG